MNGRTGYSLNEEETKRFLEVCSQPCEFKGTGKKTSYLTAEELCKMLGSKRKEDDSVERG